MSSLAAGLMRPKGQEHAGLCGSKWLREPRGCGQSAESPFRIGGFRAALGASGIP